MSRWSLVGFALCVACGRAGPAPISLPPALPTQVADVLPWADDLFVGSLARRAVSLDGDAVAFGYVVASRGGVDAGPDGRASGLRYYRRSTGVLLDLVPAGTGDIPRLSCISRDGTVVVADSSMGGHWWNTETGAAGVLDGAGYPCALDTARGLMATSFGVFRFPSGELLIELRGDNLLSASADWLLHSDGDTLWLVDLRTLILQPLPVPVGTELLSGFWVGDRLVVVGQASAPDGSLTLLLHECQPETLDCAPSRALPSSFGPLLYAGPEQLSGRFLEVGAWGWRDIHTPDAVHPIRAEGVSAPGGWELDLSPDGRVLVIWAPQIYFTELPP